MEQITGNVIIKNVKNMKVYAFDSSGKRVKEVNATCENGFINIILSLNDECMNYEIVLKEGKS